VSGPTAIRRALAERLADLPGEVKVAIGEEKYGSDPFKRLVVQIILGEQSEENAEALDLLLDSESDSSAASAIEADTTLGGLTADLHVTSHSGYRLYQTPSGPQLGAEWRVNYLT
jgi:hypothetical protein